MVEVLLATYNGGKFIREQIDSILNQDYGDLIVLARDDRSIDGTVEILREYARRYPARFKLIEASPFNNGILSNFLSLMEASTAPYVCFCDQDDVWLPNKVSRTKAAMDELERRWGPKTPLLVFTDLRVVDEGLNTRHPSFWSCMGIDPERIDDFARLLASPVVTGCTMMANRSLVEVASAMPKEASLHDRWMGLLASAMGKTAFVRDQTVLYRQHDKNAIGTGKDSGPRSLFQRIRESPDNARSYVRVWQTCQRDAAALLRLHGVELQPNIRKVLEAFVRCESNDSRFVRLTTFIAHAFYPGGGNLSKLAIAWYLWLGRVAWSQKIDRA